MKETKNQHDCRYINDNKCSLIRRTLSIRQTYKQQQSDDSINMSQIRNNRSNEAKILLLNAYEMSLVFGGK